MLKNIVRPEPTLEVTYGLRFYSAPYCGFEFPCDENGTVNLLTRDAWKNYNYCLLHPEKFAYAFKVIHKYKHWNRDNPYGTCHCGERVELVNEYRGACQCPNCGQWYNLSGQELKPVDEWEEDLDEDY